MINVLIFSTQTSARPTISIEGGSTFAELKSAISDAGVTTSNMKAMIRESRLTIEQPNAIIPTTDFTLMLTPGRVKSGS
mgnify:FL=1|tara:strand:- start:2187 stop:2423 length:237 start_codon:yes stop_codon:yes gene_type:complete